VREGLLRLSGRRASHLLGVLKVGRGDVLEGACINQGPCELVVEDLESDKVILKVGPVQLKELSKEQAKISLVVALPRPQMFKRVLQVSAQFGVADITFVGSERVEKSFFQSKELEPDRSLCVLNFLVLRSFLT